MSDVKAIGKLRYDLIPPEMINALAEALTVGIKDKHTDSEYSMSKKGKEEYYRAQFHHMMDDREGIVYDEESGLEHIKAAFVSIGCIITLREREKKAGKKQTCCNAHPKKVGVTYGVGYDPKLPYAPGLESDKGAA